MKRGIGGFAVLIALVVAAFFVSPWPSVWIIRAAFDRGAAEASAKLASLVPDSITTTRHRYDPADPQAMLDIHRPANLVAGAPVVVWIHGGGFVSGRRGDITNYAKILAGKGFAVVNIDYTIAPEATYPGPIRQTLRALAFLDREGASLGLPNKRFVLAGDSAGAQIAAQTAAVVTHPAYARLVGVTPEPGGYRIAGALLHCGVYDIADMGRDGGLLGWFVGAAGWAYSGKRDWRNDRQFLTMSLAPHLTKAFPPAFISAGNADPLGPQSVALARNLAAAGVPVETLFFPPDHQPALGHEYQFDLATAAGRLALERSVEWLRQLGEAP